MEHASRWDRTALVVDDDAFVVSALAELLEEDGFDVHTASNGFSALRQALELRPAVMLLDLALPERSGGDLLHDLRADPLTRDMAIVVVSGHADALSESQIAETDGVIPKPWDEAELLLTVHRAVQRAASRRAEVAPIAAVSHRETASRARLASTPRRTRGRR
jgi:two-component system chemotaxis response regulator CheY